MRLGRLAAGSSGTPRRNRRRVYTRGDGHHPTHRLLHRAGFSRRGRDPEKPRREAWNPTAWWSTATREWH